MAFGYELRLASQTEWTEPLVLGVAPCGQTVTRSRTLRGDYDVQIHTIAKYVPIAGWGLNGGYRIGMAIQFRGQIRTLNASHTCTGGPTHHKQIQVDVKYRREVWELWSTGLWDAHTATVTLTNPIAVENQSCIDWRPCSAVIVTEETHR